MKEIQNIIEQVEEGVITAQESVKLIKAIVLEKQEDELLDFAFSLNKESHKLAFTHLKEFI